MQLVIANHPMPIRSFEMMTPEYHGGRCIMKAIKHELSIYIMRNNLDCLGDGPSHRLAGLIELQKLCPIVPNKRTCYKLTTIIPSHLESSMLSAFYTSGMLLTSGSLVGHLSRIVNSISHVTSVRQPWELLRNDWLECSKEKALALFIPSFFKEKAIQLLLNLHPYERVTYYLEPLEVMEEDGGTGVIGVLPIALPAKYFLKYTKTKLGLSFFKNTGEVDQPIKTVAIYAGNGSWLLDKICKQGIDAFITTGLCYDDFLEANGRTLLLDIDCHTTWLGLKKRIVALLSKEFSHTTIVRCKTATNPIHYNIKD